MIILMVLRLFLIFCGAPFGMVMFTLNGKGKFAVCCLPITFWIVTFILWPKWISTLKEMEDFSQKHDTFLNYNSKCIEPLDVYNTAVDLKFDINRVSSIWKFEIVIVLYQLLTQSCYAWIGYRTMDFEGGSREKSVLKKETDEEDNKFKRV